MPYIVSIGTIANLLSSILTILLTCPNNDTLLCYSNDPLLTVYSLAISATQGSEPLSSNLTASW